MRNVATPREEGRKFAVPICVMSSARNAAGNAALHAATLGLLHDFGGTLDGTATPDWDPLLHVWQPFVSGGKLRR